VRIVTRAVALANLKERIGADLRDLAFVYGITTFETGKQNKGWKGLVLERLAGLEPSNAKAPNGLSFELKSVSFQWIGGTLRPRETMAITMINPDELKAHDFFDSHCWAKLKAMIFCAVLWRGPNAERAELIKVASLDFAEDDELIQEIKADYDFIRSKLMTQGFAALTGRDGRWLQARTKGRGHGSTSRAFYARKALVAKIFELADGSDVSSRREAA
jgi:DNA mismatch repair protein MutH